MPPISRADAPLLSRMVTPAFRSERDDLTPGEFDAVLTEAQAVLGRRWWFIREWIDEDRADDAEHYVDGEIEYTRRCGDLDHLTYVFEYVDGTIAGAAGEDARPVRPTAPAAVSNSGDDPSGPDVDAMLAAIQPDALCRPRDPAATHKPAAAEQAHARRAVSGGARLRRILNGEIAEANEQVARDAREDAACATRIRAVLDGAAMGVVWTVRARLAGKVGQTEFEKTLAEALALPVGTVRDEYLQARGVTRLEMAEAPNV